MSLRGRCGDVATILRNTPVSDGAGNSRDNYQVIHARVPMLVPELSAEQRQRGGGPTAVGTHRVTVPNAKRYDVRAGDRIALDGLTLEVRGVRNPSRADRFLSLDCTEYKSDAE